MKTEEEILPDILEFYISQIDILIEMGDARSIKGLIQLKNHMIETKEKWKPKIKHL